MRCLLIDKIISYEKGKRITGIKNVTMSENFLQDHFPGFPVMPGMLQLEAVLQLASWLMFVTTDFARKLSLVSIKAIKFKEFIVPGDQMRLELDIASCDDVQVVCNAKISVGDKLKTDIRQIKLAYVHVEDIEDPLKAKAHFDFITGSSPLGAYGYSKGRLL